MRVEGINPHFERETWVQQTIETLVTVDCSYNQTVFLINSKTPVLQRYGSSESLADEIKELEFFANLLNHKKTAIIASLKEEINLLSTAKKQDLPQLKRVVFNPFLLLQMTLPHMEIGFHYDRLTTPYKPNGFGIDNNEWVYIRNGDYRHVLKGRYDGHGCFDDLPYKSFPRMLLLLLHKEMVTDGANIRLGSDLALLLERLGFSDNDFYRDRFKEDMRRMVGMEFLTDYYQLDEIAIPDRFRDVAQASNSKIERNCLKLIPIKKYSDADNMHSVLIDDFFYNMSLEHPFTYDMEIVKKLSGSSYALDLYVLLCYWLPRVKRGERFFIEWEELFLLNGHCISEIKNYRKRMREALKAVTDVFPLAAKVDMTGNKNIIIPFCKYDPPVFP